MQFQLNTLLTAFMALVNALPVQAMNGWASWYYQYGAGGSCGETHGDGDFVAAVGPSWGPNTLCGRNAALNWNGVTTYVQVVDTCEGCGYDDIDLSVAAFGALTIGDLGLGKIYGVTWWLT